MFWIRYAALNIGVRRNAPIIAYPSANAKDLYYLPNWTTISPEIGLSAGVKSLYGNFYI